MRSEKENIVEDKKLLQDLKDKISREKEEMFNKIQRFKVKFDEYKKSVGKEDMKAYFVVIPYSMIDRITGEPTVELVQEVKGKIEQL